MKSKSYNKKKMLGMLLMPALACSLSTMAYAPKVSAATIDINLPSSTPQYLDLTDTLNVNSSLDVSGDSTTAVTVYDTATGVTINNSGQIIGDTNYHTIYVESLATGTTINNFAGATIGKLADTQSWSTLAAVYYGGTMDGTLDNSGTISSAGSSADLAYGIYVNDDLSGILTNQKTGVITASVTSSTNVSATAIYINGELSNALTNHGTIEAKGNNTGTSSNGASVNGIYINGNLSGTLTNSSTGKISALARDVGTSSAGNASAQGLYLDGTLTNILDNHGTIEAKALVNDSRYSTTAYAQASALYLSNFASTGKLTNSGTISAYAEARNTSPPATATAWGLTIAGNLDGTLTNTSTGKITAEAKAINETYTAYAQAYGIEMADVTSTGKFDNAGTISAVANATCSNYSAIASATGINMGGVAKGGTFTNSGTISGTATADGQSSYAYASASGLSMYGNLAGTLTNTSTGMISGKATAFNANSSSAASAWAHGLVVSSIEGTGTLDNQGTIRADAYATCLDYSALAYVTGLYTSGIVVGGALTNSGTIAGTATADGGSSYAYASAYGLELAGTIAGTLTNTSTGKISGTATAFNNANASYSATAYAYGLDAGQIAGDLKNQGTISAEANATVFDTYADAEAAALDVSTILAGGTLTNSGTITATATATRKGTGKNSYSYVTATATGLSTGSILGSLTNTSTGSIKATATADGGPAGAGFAYAYALDMSYIDTGVEVLNDGGLISATAIATSKAPAGGSYPSASAMAYGVYGGKGGIAGKFTNNGTISATATASAFNGDTTEDYNDAGAYGIFTFGVAGALENSGTITATATHTFQGAEDVNVYAYGIDLYTLASGATLTNTGSGNIAATATLNQSNASATFVRAAGIDIDVLDGTLNNSGTISGVSTNSPADGYSLYVGETSGSGTVNNLAGGQLLGNLYVGGLIAVNNGGTIDLPLEAAAQVASNYNQDAGGTLRVAVKSTTEYATLAVGDTASFADGTGLAVNVVNGYTLLDGEVINDVVTATNALNATSFTVTDNIALLDFSAIIDGNTVDLAVERGLLLLGDLVIANGNTGALGVANALYTALENGQTDGIEDVANALFTLGTETEIAEAMDQLVPVLNGDGPREVLTLLNDTGRIIGARQASKRGMNSGDPFFTDRNAWVAPYGSWANQDDNNGAYGYDADTYGIMFGADGEVDGPFSLGAAFAYSNSDVDGNNSTTKHNLDIDSFQLIAYGTYHLDDRTDLDMQATYGMHDVDSKRSIPLTGVTARASYDSRSTSIGAKLGRNFAMGENTVLTPSARATYAYVDDDGYTEKGAGDANLKVKGNDVDELILAVDGKLTHQCTETLQAAVNLGVGYDTLADEGSIKASFAGAPGVAFATTGIEPDEWIGYVGAGITYGKEGTTQATLRYDAEIREDSDNQAISLKVNIPF